MSLFNHLTLHHIITNYPELQAKFPMNRLFFDHGEEAILETIRMTLNKDDFEMVAALEFVSKSLLQYQKQSWRTLLSKDFKTILVSLSKAGNYFARAKSIEILHQLAGNDVKALEDYYLWLQDQFHLHYGPGKDPLVLYTIFQRLNTRYGGTWVYDYEIDMITKMLEHLSPAMQIVGLACFESMNADRDEVPESLWHLIDEMKAKYAFEFFEFSRRFENKLKEEDKFSYLLAELESFIKNYEV